MKSEGDATIATQLKEAEHPSVVMVRSSGKAYVIAKALGEAFTLAYYLQKTCRRQLLVGTHDTILVDDTVWAHAYGQTQSVADFVAGVEWPSVKASVQRQFIARPLVKSEAADDSEEQKLRLSLARCHRKLHEKGLDELTWNHCSALLGDKMLVTPGDSFWDDIMPDDILLSSRNITANILHSAVYAVTSAKAIIHTHAPALEAVSCIKGGLIGPHGSELAGGIAYHAWQGISDDSEECKVIGETIKKVPDCVALIANNHGAFTWGKSVEEAVERHIALESACRAQLLKAGGTGATRIALYELQSEFAKKGA
jgi:L-fuculose-phosphate aldolase